MSHDHDHHEHAHAHGIGHSHAPKSFHAAFAIGTGLNLAFVIAEMLFGVTSHSLALIADAGHNLGDVVGLLLAWAASVLGRSVPTATRTYGYRSSSILAALFNAILLLVGVGAIAWEAIQRFQAPAPVEGRTVIWVAVAGIAINSATALLFMSGRKSDLNLRGAFLHMAVDAVVSLGVVLAGLLIVWTGALWLDPAVSLVIVVAIIASTWGLLRDSFNLALQAVPPGTDLPAVKKYLGALPGVVAVHDIHIWGMSTTETALTAHLVRGNPAADDALLERATRELHEYFRIEHATIQLETPALNCALAPDDKV